MTSSGPPKDAGCTVELAVCAVGVVTTCLVCQTEVMNGVLATTLHTIVGPATLLVQKGLAVLSLAYNKATGAFSIQRPSVVLLRTISSVFLACFFCLKRFQVLRHTKYQ